MTTLVAVGGWVLSEAEVGAVVAVLAGVLEGGAVVIEGVPFPQETTKVSRINSAIVQRWKLFMPLPLHVGSAFLG
jgi:hypothetical protein